MYVCMYDVSMYGFVYALSVSVNLETFIEDCVG
jgi:hypothetical protein